MYTRAQKIITSSENLSNYIEGKDIYNSKLLTLISEATNVERKVYEITAYEYRPDLIAKDFYGSESWSGLVILQAGRGLENLTRGSYLLLLPKDEIQKLINSL